MLNRDQSILFLNEFRNYFGEYTIAAELEQSGRFTVFTNPYLDFDTLLAYLCESIFAIFHYSAHLEILVYPFGSNDHILISIN